MLQFILVHLPNYLLIYIFIHPFIHFDYLFYYLHICFTHFYFSQDSGVEIAAMDATAHTPPGMYKVQVREQWLMILGINSQNCWLIICTTVVRKQYYYCLYDSL